MVDGRFFVSQGTVEGCRSPGCQSYQRAILRVGRPGFDQDIDLEVVKVYSSPYATHVRYTVTK